MAFISLDSGRRERQLSIGSAFVSAGVMVLVALVCLQALLGVLRLRSLNTIKGFATLDSPQFAIAGEPMRLHLQILPQRDQPLTIELGAEVLSNYDVGPVAPLPNVLTTTGGKTRIVFDPIGDRATDIDLSLVPKTWGSHSTPVRVLFGAAAVAETSFTQWVLP